jgi:peptidoglycan hydrolase-like protein with peptidoglycan-binding domain
MIEHYYSHIEEGTGRRLPARQFIPGRTLPALDGSKGNALENTGIGIFARRVIIGNTALDAKPGELEEMADGRLGFIFRPKGGIPSWKRYRR